MQGNPDTQQPACADVCDRFAQSLKDITSSSYWCGSGSRSGQVDTWKKWCNAPSNSSATCVEGNVNEGNCGFGDWTNGLCEYCQGDGAGDSCCSSASSSCPGISGSSTSGSTSASGTKTAGAGSANKSGGSKGLSGGAIAGIVVGVVVGVLLIAAILGFLCWRRKKRTTKSKPLAAAPYEKFGGNEAQNAQSSHSVSPASMQDTAPLTGAGTGTESHAGRNAALGAAAGAGAGAGAAAMAAHNRHSPETTRSTSPVATRTTPAGTAPTPTNATAAAAAPAAAPMTQANAAPVSQAPVSQPSTTAAGNFHRGPGIGAGTAAAAAAAVPAAAAGAAAAQHGSRPLPASPPRQATSPPPRPTTSSPVSPVSPTSASSGGRSLPSPPGSGAALGAGAVGAAASPFASPPKATSPPPQDRNNFYNVSTAPAPGQFSSTPIGGVHSAGGHNATPVPAAGVAGMAGVGAGAMAAARQSQPPSAATTPNGSTVALPSAPTAALAQAPAPSEAVASNANRQAQILDATGAYITPGSMVTVMHPYAAQMPDELTLAPGMRLKVVDLFDDGWGTAVEVASNGSQGRRGQFPTVCVQASS